MEQHSPLSTAWRPRLPAIFWTLTLIALALWAALPGYTVGWDLNVYRNAWSSLRAGHDPYVDGMAVQRIFHATLALHPHTPPPYTYVYSPITLPVLRWLLPVPVAVVGAIYWTAYALASATAIAIGWKAVTPEERPVFALLAPAAIFFPGLLQNDVVFSGNVAAILYGLVFACAWTGWTRSRWTPFYVAVLLASCCKAPLLSLVAIAPLSAPRQWLRAGITATLGVLLFALQPHMWPVLFRHYIEAVDLQFSFNRDFSSSPAGLAANALFHHADYHAVSLIAYIAYAVPVFLCLLRAGRMYRTGALTLQQWMPLVLVGTVLLNPRVMEYDVAPIALPMALLCWRALRPGRSVYGTAVVAGTVFVLANIVGAGPWRDTMWRPVEGLLLLCSFAAGTYRLLQGKVVRNEDLASPHRDETLVLR